MQGSLFGKLAIVTGAGSGIGKATCQVFAREGAKVIAANIDKESATETLNSITNNQQNNDHLSLQIDVSNSDSVKTCLETVMKHYKQPPTVIVNCAGITRDNFLLKLSEEDFDEVIGVNLKGTFLIMKTFAKALVDNGVQNGSIVTIASIVAKNGNIGQSNYTASKAGVELMTKTAAKELGKFGIRCNTVLPGFIKSPMSDAVPDKIKEKFQSQIALRRIGQPEEVAELIAFLASDKSSFLTGSSIDIAGGFP